MDAGFEGNVKSAFFGQGTGALEGNDLGVRPPRLFMVAPANNAAGLDTNSPN
jgi:hypothetical protein